MQKLVFMESGWSGDYQDCIDLWVVIRRIHALVTEIFETFSVAD